MNICEKNIGELFRVFLKKKGITRLPDNGLLPLMFEQKIFTGGSCCSSKCQILDAHKVAACNCTEPDMILP